jgi:membrane-bound inhibitor of C-type lysozyme
MRHFTIFIILIALSIQVNAQLQVIASSGGHEESSESSIAWTLGEVVIAAHTKSGVMLTQGFHQSNLEITTAVDESHSLDIQVKAYPNPVQNKLTVEVDNNEAMDLSLQLFDINGRLLLKRQLNNSRQNLNLEKYAQGQYILWIRSDKGLIKSFNIVKH